MYNCFIESRGKIVEYYYDQETESPKSRFEFSIDLEGDTVCSLFVYQAQVLQLYYTFINLKLIKIIHNFFSSRN